MLNSERKYLIPDFQRPFSWSKEEIGELWEDLQPLFRGAQEELFLGTIVVETSSPTTGVIWDGQQRLAVLVIFLAAARDKLLASSSSANQQLGGAIQTNYIMGSPFAGLASPVLTLGELDQPTFHAFVVLQPGEAGRKDLSYWQTLTAVQRRTQWSPKVVEGLRLLSGLIEDYSQRNAAAYGGKEGAIRQMLTMVLNKIKLIAVETGSESEAYRTFETLNDRGLELSASDLIKNFVLSRVQGDPVLKAQMKQQWDLMARLLGAERLTTFIRHFYMSRFGRTTKAELFANIKRRVNPQQGPGLPVPDLLQTLKDQAEFYYRLVEPASAGWTSPNLTDALGHLSALGATQWIPLLLSAQSVELGEPEFEKLVKVAETLVVRGVVVGGLNPNSLERTFGDAAASLWTSCKMGGMAPPAALSTALAAVKSEIPGDAVFKSQFLELEGLSRTRARFLLECIERQAQTEASTGVAPLPSVLDLEHIYPESPGPGWPADSVPGGTPNPNFVGPDERQRLGNLTLLHFRPNRSQRNAPYSQKCTNYAASPIIITKSIPAAVPPTSLWNMTTIQARQSQLCEQALRTWPIPA